ncbi:hypothetical protein C7M84_006248 [Penaeus vannamei]|uniref:CUB domain-containing protein n=1 Tax=Penaeus vannamei TaxID=6689 RepID=A0A3R7N263_PENVA|nr:hypothetical protein C7M84_006248 [Penaeus vannamei]
MNQELGADYMDHRLISPEATCWNDGIFVAAGGKRRRSLWRSLASSERRKLPSSISLEVPCRGVGLLDSLLPPKRLRQIDQMGPWGLLLFALAAEANVFKFVEYGDGDQEALSRMKRRLEIPLPGGDNNETVVFDETTDICTWCDNDDLEVDDEHRATTVQRYTRYIPPGTCIENKSPRYPEKYPNNKDIRWKYTGASGSILTFKVIKGGVQKHYKCQKDYVEIYADGKKTR